jgi:6-phospho 3-hexuloisomerase
MFRRSVEFIVGAIAKSLEGVDGNDIGGAIIEANRIMVYGVGRSGLVARAFATRLMHLGLETYVMGETVSPPIEAGDVVILISGSGRTSSVLRVGELAKQIGAKVLAVTSDEGSPLYDLADQCVVLRAIDNSELAPLGTIFEDSAQVFLDGLIAALMIELGESESTMSARHATLE